MKMKIGTHLCLLPKPLHHLLQPSLALHKLLSNLNKERFNFEDALLWPQSSGTLCPGHPQPYF